MSTELWIKDTSSKPTEGWKYPAIAGPDISAPSYAQLHGAVAKHYRANGKPEPSKEDVIRYLCESVTVSCYEGKHPFRNKFTDRPSYVERGLKGPDWPILLRPLKLLAQPGDAGLGDIVHRVIGDQNSNAWKAWYLSTFGRPCGCSRRQAALNEDYPL